MNSKTLLLSLAVITVGLFAMPSTLSMFNGMHTFKSGGDVRCVDCHSDIALEFQNSGMGINGTPTQIHSTLTGATTSTPATKCTGCHARGGNVTSIPLSTGAFLYNTNATVNGQHAAVLVACQTCHNDNATDNSSGGGHKFIATEAHTPFVNATWSSSPFQYSQSVACIGCHTGSANNKTVTITRNATGIQISVSENLTGIYSNWATSGK